MDQEERHRRNGEQIAREFGAVLTEDREEDTIPFLRDMTRQYIGLNAIMRRRMTAHGVSPEIAEVIAALRYHSIEELLIFNTSPVDADIMATDMDPMIKGNCFANAFRVSLMRPEMRYTEGWATMERSYPTHHAWLTGPDGAIHDPTWKTIGVEEGMKRLRACYFGVQIDTGKHLGWFHESANANILYDGEMMIEGVLQEGMSFFDQYDHGIISPADVDDVIQALDAHGLWRREPDSHIFVHSRTGQKWDGRKNCFV